MRLKAFTAALLGAASFGALAACSSAPDYSFIESSDGQNLPMLHCLPLHACAIRFKGGETIRSFTIGDPEGWGVRHEETGSPDNPVSILLLLPKVKAHSTNILVTTTRTLYNFGLSPKR